MYQRARRTPTNPNSPEQAAVRAIVAALANLWTNTLSEVQRLTWDLYATNVQLTNKLGDPMNVTGLNMYVRSNTPRLQAAMTRIDTAPGVFNLGSFTNPTFVVDAANEEVDVSFTNTDSWATAIGGAMLVFASRPQGAAINFFKGPYRFAGTIPGAVVPPTSPATIALPFAVVPAQKVFLRVSVVQTDGRLSYPFRDVSVAT
jgi:hypothetical protein